MLCHEIIYGGVPESAVGSPPIMALSPSQIVVSQPASAIGNVGRTTRTSSCGPRRPPTLLDVVPESSTTEIGLLKSPSTPNSISTVNVITMESSSDELNQPHSRIESPGDGSRTLSRVAVPKSSIIDGVEPYEKPDGSVSLNWIPCPGSPPFWISTMRHDVHVPLMAGVCMQYLITEYSALIGLRFCPATAA